MYTDTFWYFLMESSQKSHVIENYYDEEFLIDT